MLKVFAITLSVLAAQSVLADISMKSIIDLSSCRSNGKSVKTKVKGKIDITSVISTGNLYSSGSESIFSQEGGVDGSPYRYSCFYYSNFGNHDAKTIANLDGKKVFEQSSTLLLKTLDHSEMVDANDPCDGYPAYPLSAFFQLVPTTAGQIVIKDKRFTVLLNYSAAAYGRVFESGNEKAFLIDKVQGKRSMSFHIRPGVLTSSKNLNFTDCEASLNIQ